MHKLNSVSRTSANIISMAYIQCQIMECESGMYDWVRDIQVQAYSCKRYHRWRMQPLKLSSDSSSYEIHSNMQKSLQMIPQYCACMNKLKHCVHENSIKFSHSVILTRIHKKICTQRAFQNLLQHLRGVLWGMRQRGMAQLRFFVHSDRLEIPKSVNLWWFQSLWFPIIFLCVVLWVRDHIRLREI